MSELTVREIRREELEAAARLHARWGTEVSPATLDWEYFDPDLTRPGILVGAFDGEELIGTQGYIPYRGWSNPRVIGRGNESVGREAVRQSRLRRVR